MDTKYQTGACARVVRNRGDRVMGARKAAKERMARAQAETLAVVESGVCPRCGSKVKRNYSISGWWQCEQYGAVTHRARPNDPQCSWQGFTS